MNVTKLNCSACGAPINVPEDVSSINCPSCGTALGIERGDGFIALRIAEKITKAFSENAQVTRAELQRIQLSSDLNTLQMQLSNILSEIRMVERGPQNYTSKFQLFTLHTQELNYRERIRLLNHQLFAPPPDDISGNMSFIQGEIDAVNSEILVLQNSNHPQLNEKIPNLVSLKNKLDAELLNYRILNLKGTLLSLKKEDVPQGDQEEIAKLLDLIESDQKLILPVANTIEGKIVLQELDNRKKVLSKAWDELEDLRRINSGLPPKLVVPELEQPLSNKTIKKSGNGCLFAILAFIGIAIIGIVLVNNLAAFAKQKNHWPTVTFFISQIIAILVGTIIYLRRSSPSIIIKGLFHLLDIKIRTQIPNQGKPRIRLTKFIVGLNTLLITLFMFLAASFLIFVNDPKNFSLLLIIFGIILSPLIGWITAERTSLLTEDS